MILLPGATITIPNPLANHPFPGFPSENPLEFSRDSVIAYGDLHHILRRSGHPYTSDEPFKSACPPGDYSDWWWVDVLHYRRTGRFAAALKEIAGTDPFLNAYSEGYMTHIAADAVGHPYVNALVGGPYRNHVLRHMVLETIMDTWVWHHFKGDDITSARLDKTIDVGNDFEIVAHHLMNAVEKVYTNPNGRPSIQPGLITLNTDEWQKAYDALLFYLDYTTNTGLTPPEPPPSSPQEFLELIEEYIEGAVTGLQELMPDWDDPLDIVRFILFGAVVALGYLVMLLDIPGYALRTLFNIGPQWFLYMIELAMYQFIVDLRWLLTLSGWAKPGPGDLGRPLAQQAFHVPADRAGPNAFNYPYLQVNHNIPFFWLVDPSLLYTGIERYGSMQDGNEASPYAEGQTPDVIVTGDAYDQSRDSSLQKFPIAANVESSITYAKDTIQGPQLGNAVEFALKLLRGKYPAGSFDLDGDLGYGYLSWEGPPPEYGAELR
jgi:hypothetical protein